MLKKNDNTEMISPIPTPPIFKITLGNDIKTGFTYSVGQTLGEGENKIKITRIICDHNHFYFYGVLRYIIFATDIKKNDDEFMWKYFSNVPISVTLDSKNAKHLIV